MEYGFVYIWYDRKYKRYYVGCRWGSEDDGYVCSSSWMKASYKKRPDDFKRRIIARVYTNRADLYEEEYRWLSMMKQEELHGPRYYNIYNHHFSHWSTDNKNQLSVKEKISNTKRKHFESEEGQISRKLMSDRAKACGAKPPSQKGKIPWNKGLTKETDERVAANAKAVSKPKSNTTMMGRYNKLRDETKIKGRNRNV